MKVTGYQLQQRLRELRNELEMLLSHFENSKTYFPPDPTPSLGAIGQDIERCERNIAILQSAQMHYNLATPLPGTDVALALAIKLVGPMGRLEKMWRSIAKGKQRDRYSYGNDQERKADTVYAQSSVSPDAAMVFASQYAREASKLREGIAKANQTELEMDLDSTIFG